MVRRWVTSGRLKVKREPVGVPPRTRLVRLSDVAKIRPIIDPTAAISGEVRKLDLPSIPRQQLQIMQDHERLTKQIELALEASKQYEANTHAAFLELSEDLSHRLLTHRDELQRVLNEAEQQHEALATVVRDQAHQLEQSHAQLEDQARRHQQGLEQLGAELQDQLHTAQAILQQAQQELERRLIEQSDQLHRDLKEQQEALVTLRLDTKTLVEHQMHEVWTALEQVKHDQAQEGAQRDARLEQVEYRIEQVATHMEDMQNTAHGFQQRVERQESRLQEFWKLLQGEIAARQALDQQVQQNIPTRKRTTRKRTT